MARRKKPKGVTRALAALGDEELLIAGLDPLTYRDLKNNPPAASETMQQVGISKTNLDTVVRSWINRDFREPRELSPLSPGAITSSTKWSKLVEMCGCAV